MSMPAERAGNGMPQSGLAATFRRLFRPHQESLLGRLHSPLYLRWQAVLQLASMVALVKLPMETRFEPGWLVATLLSLVPYLICHGRMYLRPIRQMPLNAAGLMLTALALAPFNQGAVVYLIVAGLTMALHPSWRAWIGTVIAASAAAAVVVATTGAPQGMLVAVPLASLFGGFGNRVYMRGVRRDAELRLSQEEVRRLATLAEREMEEVERVARHALGEVRAAVTGMRRGDLAAELVSARLMLEASGILLGGGAPESLTLPREVEAPLALVLREAVCNIHRHARASRARISISIEGDGLDMRIGDNGRGGLAAHGNGVSGMRERVRALGGTLGIDSPPRRGTVLCIHVPLPAHTTVAMPASPGSEDAAGVPAKGATA